MLVSNMSRWLVAVVGLSSAQTSAVSGASAAVSMTSTATPSATTRSLAENESIVTEPTYVSSLTSLILTTYTTTMTTASANTRPTGLPSSLYCDAGYANATGPFCLPNNGTQQIKGKKYSVTWNYDFAPNCSDVYVSLTYYNNVNAQQVTSISESNVLGFWNYTVESSWLNGQDSQYAQFQILPYGCSSGTVDPSAGPIIEFLNKAPTTVEKATSKDEIIGLSVGLPLAVFAFLGAAFFVMWWNKGHRQIPVFARKKGYSGRKQRNIRLAELGTTRNGETYTDDA